MTGPYKAELAIALPRSEEQFERQWQALGQAMWCSLAVAREARCEGPAKITATLEVPE